MWLARELRLSRRTGWRDKSLPFTTQLGTKPLRLACRRPSSSRQNPQSMGGRHKSFQFL